MKSEENKLIAKGHYSISIPILGIYAAAFFIFGMNFLVLFLTSIIAWLFWAVVVPKWKLNSIKQIDSTESYVKWYSNAIWNLLIWPDSSFFTRTEIWSKNEKREYQEFRNSLLNISTDDHL